MIHIERYIRMDSNGAPVSLQQSLNMTRPQSTLSRDSNHYEGTMGAEFPRTLAIIVAFVMIGGFMTACFQSMGQRQVLGIANASGVTRVPLGTVLELDLPMTSPDDKWTVTSSNVNVLRPEGNRMERISNGSLQQYFTFSTTRTGTGQLTAYNQMRSSLGTPPLQFSIQVG